MATTEEEVSIFLSQALFQQATGLTQTALETIGRIKSFEGLDPTELKSIAAVQHQAGDFQGVLTTLKGQEDILSLMLRGKAEFGLGSFVNAAALFQKANG